MRVAVIGGGIQGACISMELATRGIEVDLFEASQWLMEGASRHNEGKIHLGFVYANDPSNRTSELMFRGARQFPALMRRWLGSAFDQVPVSTPFNYAVHKESLLSAHQLQQAYDRMALLMRSAAHTSGSYFDIDDPGLVVRLGGSDHEYGQSVDTVFSTQEVAVDPRTLADLIVKKISDGDGIRILTGTSVTGVQADQRLIDVSTHDGNMNSMGPYDHIVNCAWGGRPALDATAGLVLDGPWTFRMKYFLVGTAQPDLSPIPSTTVVLGSFGDVVDYGNGEYYLCWYPSGQQGWSTAVTPPRWPTRPGTAKAAEIERETVANLESVVPGVLRLMTHGVEAPEVFGGLIYALGNTDVDDPGSEFHRRSEIGLRSKGNYHSVDTGKYTTAPLFAIEAADRIMGS